MSAEPIVRYHARVTGGGRIVIPDITRKLLGIKKGNIVKLKVAKILNVIEKGNKIIVETSPEVVFEAKVGSRGLITIPEKAREVLRVQDGDYVEVELLDYYPVRVGEVSILDFV